MGGDCCGKLQKEENVRKVQKVEKRAETPVKQEERRSRK